MINASAYVQKVMSGNLTKTLDKLIKNQHPIASSGMRAKIGEKSWRNCLSKHSTYGSYHGSIATLIV